MKKYTITLIISLFTFSSFAQNAKTVLDKTADTFQKAGGIKAIFEIEIKNGTVPVGFTRGTILLDGKKFMLETDEAVTWFDGETQWSYMEESDEINISNPTEEELQSINPYTLLSIYKQNYTCKIGDATRFQGKPIYEINLTTKDKKKDISNLTLYIDKATYEPLFILAQLRDGSWNEIIIKEYKTGIKHNKNVFVFNPAKYPNAELIDLR